MRQLWKELTNQTTIPILRTDNEEAAKLTQASTFHRRTRHILHKYDYIRTEVRTNQLSLEGIPGKDNWADFLTKSLPRPALEKWRNIVLGK
jgi:uncharacterized protein YutD